MQEIRITDQAVIRLSHNPEADNVIRELSTHQLETLIHKCRDIAGTDNILESASWTMLERQYHGAIVY